MDKKLLEKLEKQLHKLALLFRSADEKDLKPVVKGAVLDVFNLFSKTQQATIEEITEQLPKLWAEHRAEVSHAMEYGTKKDIPNFFVWVKDKLKKEGG